MANPDEKDGFISLLLEETYNVLPGSADSIQSNGELADYFNCQTKITKNNELFNQLESVCRKYEDSVYPLDYIESIKMFRTYLHDSPVDFPKNWSVFNTLFHSGCGSLTSKEDDDYLLKVLLPFDHEKGGLLVFSIDEDTFLILTKDCARMEEYLSFLNVPIENAG